MEIIARQKDCLEELLAQTGWSYHLIPRKKEGLVTLAAETIKAAVIAYKLAREKKFDIMAGTSISIGPAGRLSGATSLIFEEDDAKVVPIFARLGYPVVHYVVTPRCLAFEDHGRKHLTYRGYHELAYLHPDRYQPDPGILEVLGVESGEKYFLIRLVSLRAHHDIGQTGIGTAQAKILVERLAQQGRVFISAEAGVDERLRNYLLPAPRERIFDVMAYAQMVIGDSQTMAAEAAVLGTPALRCNTFVGRISYLEELEYKYGLTYGYHPRDFDKMMDKIDSLLSFPDLKQQWQQKRREMLADCVDVTGWILDLFEKLARA